jgi:hypothetical protein
LKIVSVVRHPGRAIVTVDMGGLAVRCMVKGSKAGTPQMILPTLYLPGGRHVEGLALTAAARAELVALLAGVVIPG